MFIEDRCPKAGVIGPAGAELISYLFVKGWPSSASPPSLHNHSEVNTENGTYKLPALILSPQTFKLGLLGNNSRNKQRI